MRLVDHSVYPPLLAFTLTLSLSATLTSLNHQNQTDTATELPLLNALFCLEVAVIYFIYTLLSRILYFALSCIESNTHPAYYYYYYDYRPDMVESNALLSVPSQGDDATEDLEPDDDEQLYNRGIQREALISSMYLGGSGCFLALPALGFWDIAVTTMLLFSLSIIGLTLEHTKHPSEFAPNQDKATVLKTLRIFRWSIYALLLCAQLGIFIKAPLSVEEPPIIMLLLAFVSPLMLLMGLPPTAHTKRLIMSPSQVLEAALPVSCLHAVLVVGWYTPIVSVGTPHIMTIFQDKNLAIFLPMLILCPFCQVVILAFILRGFRNKQTLPITIILTIATFVVQQVLYNRLLHTSDWILLAVIGKLVFVSGVFLLYRSSVFVPLPAVVEHPSAPNHADTVMTEIPL